LNTFFGTDLFFSAYTIEHGLILSVFALFLWWFFKYTKNRGQQFQQRYLLILAVVLSVLQLAKIPLNLLTGTFDVTKDIPLHMCNFLPFIFVWIYSRKDKQA
jgi:uncharacterized membrane protein YwaF